MNLLANTAAFDWSSIAQYGFPGAMLVWFLWKAEPRWKSMESAIDRLTRGNMIMLMEIQRTTPEGKRQASALIEEINQADKDRET